MGQDKFTPVLHSPSTTEACQRRFFKNFKNFLSHQPQSQCLTHKHTQSIRATSKAGIHLNYTTIFTEFENLSYISDKRRFSLSLSLYRLSHAFPLVLSSSSTRPIPDSVTQFGLATRSPKLNSRPCSIFYAQRKRRRSTAPRGF